ncbi:hypothetical protein [Streptomyces sp. NPDC016845]|uniref:hypothetical protein n=1 Tax=Streptomyces sp. NPDC016845 TaxID=3364972 RepID=UPI0037B02B13
MPEQTPPILRYFKFGHLPDHLRSVSAPFADLANQLVATLPPGPELSVALRKLLESKDAAVRAALDLPKES